jgi:hypothetical protein
MAGSLGTAIPDKLREIHQMLVSELHPPAEGALKGASQLASWNCTAFRSDVTILSLSLAI